MAEHIDWELEKENHEKKVVARSARKKVTHAGCKLPSDFLTSKEKQKMNGEAITMDMNKPVAYKVFKLWPADLQKEYLEKLVKEFGVSINAVTKMMGAPFSSFHSFLTSRHLRDVFPKNTKMNHKQIINWNLFCNGEWKGCPYPFTRDTEQDELEKMREQALQNTPESHENDLGVTNEVYEDKDATEEIDVPKGLVEAEKTVIDLLNERIKKQISEPVNIEKCCCDKVQITSMSLSMRNLKSWDDIFELLRKYPLPECNLVSISMTDEEE